MKRILIFVIIFSVLFTSCKEKDPVPDTTITPQQARDSLYYIMNQWYYWYNLMPTVNKDNYDDPYTLLEAMRYRTLDRWSFVADYDEFVAEMQGTFVGHGFRIGVDDASNARIAMIYSNSPLYAEGVRRGWIVKKINGIDIAPILIAGDATAYNNVIGAAKAGIINTFIFKKPDGNEVTISSAKSTFTVNSVMLYDTLHLSSEIAGHLVFDAFITPSATELTTAFAFFKANNIKYLILDLRYNSGGYVYIAQGLASFIGGNQLAMAGSVFARLQYNDKNQAENYSFLFKTTSSPLDISRLAVITTRLTASASEMVMNGLNPFVNVVSFGDTTNGKPTGMDSWAVGKKYYFLPVTFKVVNAINQGDYFAGIAPAKVVNDDITRDFNDRNEFCLKEAIYYLETGSVSGKGYPAFKRHPQYSEKPEWMNNVLLR